LRHFSNRVSNCPLSRAVSNYASQNYGKDISRPKKAYDDTHDTDLKYGAVPAGNMLMVGNPATKGACFKGKLLPMLLTVVAKYLVKRRQNFPDAVFTINARCSARGV